MPSTTTKRASLVQSLKGTSIMIPDLEAMLAHWPSAINMHEDQLRNEVHQRLERLFPEGRRQQKMKFADAALFGSSWWPYANFEDLCVVTHLSTWLFAWDDELDSAEYSNLVNDMDQASAFREETIRFIQACLQEEPENEAISSNYIITDIKRVCQAVRQKYPYDRVCLFFDELAYFIHSCQIEQEHQIADSIPTSAEYLNRRMGSGAVRVCLALSEFAYNILLPQEVMADSDMAVIWDATNVIICLMNDILSFKKEFIQGQVDSILPVLYVEHGSMSIAMSIATGVIKRAVENLDAAADRLLERHGQTPTLRKDLVKFIDTCKYACTGNLSWSLVSGRFRICQKTTKGGFVVTLE